MGKFEDLEKLQKLRESGVLTEEEFNQEKARVLSGENYNTNSTIVTNNSSNDLEIKGEFPLIQSKLPIKLLEGEKVIYQYEATTLTGVGSTAVNGFLTLTNKRIMFNKKTTGKSYLTTGLLGVALAAGNKNVEIKFSQITSIEGKKIRMNAGGLEITTNDGYANRFILAHTNERDMIIELVKTVVNSK